jgi:hypothetical protein
MKEYTDKIIGEARIEATQVGFTVWVQTQKRAKAIIADYYCSGPSSKINTAYDRAATAAASINRGQFLCTRKSGIIRISGKTLKVTY